MKLEPVVVDPEGRQALLLDDAAGERVRLRLIDTHETIVVSRDLLHQESDKRLTLARPLRELTAALTTLEAGERVTLPVVEERLDVDTREVVRSTVHIRKSVEEHDEAVEMPLQRKRVEVERVPVGRTVDEAPLERREGDTLIIPVVEEVLVVTKQLVLKEELRITTRVDEHVERQTVTLRREHVEVDRADAGGAASPPRSDP